MRLGAGIQWEGRDHTGTSHDRICIFQGINIWGYGKEQLFGSSNWSGFG